MSDLSKLKNAVRAMDCLASDTLAEIAAVARLALSAMESPTSHPAPETFARLFNVILKQADDTRDCIGRYAEDAGCGYSDDASMRRLDAYLASQKPSKEMMQ